MLRNNAMSKESTQKGHAWIATMDSSVSKQQSLLKALLERVAKDDKYRWLQLSCSLARGAGDELSDIDVTLGMQDDTWPEAIKRLKKLAEGLAPVSDMLEHTLIDELGRKCRHLIVIYQDSLQLSVVTMPSSWLPGERPQAVTLYDPDGHFNKPLDQYPSFKTTTPTQARQWAFFAWLNLIDMTKYLDRGSVWEAHLQLERARMNTWNLWAIACKLDYAIYGITQVLDDEVAFPQGMERTVADLKPESLRTASLMLADILQNVSERASESLPFELPPGIAEIARKRLEE